MIQKMLPILCAFTILLGFSQCTTNKNTQKANTEAPAPVQEKKTIAKTISGLKYEDNSIDFGDVEDGISLEHVFTFNNATEKEMVIESVESSCTCVKVYPQADPIAPNKSGQISIKYMPQSEGKAEGNLQDVKITVTSNLEPKQSYLYVKGKAFPRG